MRGLKLTLVALTLALAAGCGASFDMSTPGGFVELDDDAYDYRATNADGVVIAVRELDNDPRGDLEFWAGAVDAKLRRRYSAQSVHEIETDRGLAGVQIRYLHHRNGRPHHYWATIFVTADTVYLLEAGGDHEFFDANRDTVEQTISSFDG